MEKITITIQEVWAPDGKEFPKVITTPEQNKYHLYKDQAELAQYVIVGSQITIDPFETTNRAGKPITRIQNIFVDGKPVIAQEQAQPAPPTKPPTTDKIGEGQREGMVGKNRSFALAYAKDLATNGVIEKDNILEWADSFLQWLNK